MKKIILSALFSLCIMQETSSSDSFYDRQRKEEECKQKLSEFIKRFECILDECEVVDQPTLITILEQKYKKELEKCREFIQIPS